MGAERLHLALEAARLAFGVRDTHIADPAYMREPVAGLLDKGFAKKLAKLLDPGKRVPLPKSPAPSSDTIYLTVVDRDRMAVSLINSLYSGFGTGICTEKTGVMLHNRGTGFVVEPGHPNTIAPGKRPMHTIIPALAMRDGRCTMSFGVMGADFQPMGHAHVVTNMVDYEHGHSAGDRRAACVLWDEITEVERGVSGGDDRRAEVARTQRRAPPAAAWRRTGHRHRLGEGQPDRRLRPSQGRLRDRLLEDRRGWELSISPASSSPEQQVRCSSVLAPPALVQPRADIRATKRAQRGLSPRFRARPQHVPSRRLALIENGTDITLEDYAREKLFQPEVGIEKSKAAGCANQWRFRGRRKLMLRWHMLSRPPDPLRCRTSLPY